ncbi:MAG: hypothetical protein MHM6MM_002507 [Cercozoa sp. M6MM]
MPCRFWSPVVKWNTPIPETWRIAQLVPGTRCSIPEEQDITEEAGPGGCVPEDASMLRFAATDRFDILVLRNARWTRFPASAFVNLTNSPVRVLALEENALRTFSVNAVPLTWRTNITALYLDDNRLSGSLSRALLLSLGNQLEVLTVSNNFLEQFDPRDAPLLRVVNLANNRLQSLSFGFSNQRALEALFLGGNPQLRLLDESRVRRIISPTANPLLRQLDMSNTGLSTSLRFGNVFAQWPLLQVLGLDDNDISIGEDSLVGMDQLSALSLRNSLRNRGGRRFVVRALPENLFLLDLRDNDLSRVSLSQNLNRNLNGARALQILDLGAQGQGFVVLSGTTVVVSFGAVDVTRLKLPTGLPNILMELTGQQRSRLAIETVSEDGSNTQDTNLSALPLRRPFGITDFLGSGFQLSPNLMPSLSQPENLVPIVLQTSSPALQLDLRDNGIRQPPICQILSNRIGKLNLGGNALGDTDLRTLARCYNAPFNCTYFNLGNLLGPSSESCISQFCPRLTDFDRFAPPFRNVTDECALRLLDLHEKGTNSTQQRCENFTLPKPPFRRFRAPLDRIFQAALDVEVAQAQSNTPLSDARRAEIAATAYARTPDAIPSTSSRPPPLRDFLRAKRVHVWCVSLLQHIAAAVPPVLEELDLSDNSLQSLNLTGTTDSLIPLTGLQSLDLSDNSRLRTLALAVGGQPRITVDNCELLNTLELRVADQATAAKLAPANGDAPFMSVSVLSSPALRDIRLMTYSDNGMPSNMPSRITNFSVSGVPSMRTSHAGDISVAALPPPRGLAFLNANNLPALGDTVRRFIVRDVPLRMVSDGLLGDMAPGLEEVEIARTRTLANVTARIFATRAAPTTTTTVFPKLTRLSLRGNLLQNLPRNFVTSTTHPALRVLDLRENPLQCVPTWLRPLATAGLQIVFGDVRTVTDDACIFPFRLPGEVVDRYSTCAQMLQPAKRDAITGEPEPRRGALPPTARLEEQLKARAAQIQRALQATPSLLAQVSPFTWCATDVDLRDLSPLEVGMCDPLQPPVQFCRLCPRGQWSQGNAPLCTLCDGHACPGAPPAAVLAPSVSDSVVASYFVPGEEFQTSVRFRCAVGQFARAHTDDAFMERVDVLARRRITDTASASFTASISKVCTPCPRNYQCIPLRPAVIRLDSQLIPRAQILEDSVNNILLLQDGSVADRSRQLSPTDRLLLRNRQESLDTAFSIDVQDIVQRESFLSAMSSDLRIAFDKLTTAEKEVLESDLSKLGHTLSAETLYVAPCEVGSFTLPGMWLPCLPCPANWECGFILPDNQNSRIVDCTARRRAFDALPFDAPIPEALILQSADPRVPADLQTSVLCPCPSSRPSSPRGVSACTSDDLQRARAAVQQQVNDDTPGSPGGSQQNF